MKALLMTGCKSSAFFNVWIARPGSQVVSYQYDSWGESDLHDGAADGFMWGGIGALASSAVSAFKAVKTAKQGITIGEDMDKVRKAATLNNTATYKAMKGYKTINKVAGKKVANKLSLRHNKVFIKRMRKLKAVIYDNGPKGTRAVSPWYKMERKVLKGYKSYAKMY